MSQHTRFLDAIIDEPEEDGHRLVYADYLEEQGDPRGEFVRLQCERKHLTPLTKEHDACVQRESELLARHEGQWDSELATSFGKKLTYDRGFVNHVEMRATQFLKVGQDLLRRTPLETIRLTFLKGQVQKLEGEGLLERLRGIDLRSVRYPAEEFERLIQALPLLTRLHAKQSCHPVNEHYAKVLLDGPAGKNLQHLEFTSIETGFYRFLESRGGLPNLKSFRLGNAVMADHAPSTSRTWTGVRWNICRSMARSESPICKNWHTWLRSNTSSFVMAVFPNEAYVPCWRLVVLLRLRKSFSTVPK